jgi:hypothetical protein
VLFLIVGKLSENFHHRQRLNEKSECANVFNFGKAPSFSLKRPTKVGNHQKFVDGRAPLLAPIVK